MSWKPKVCEGPDCGAEIAFLKSAKDPAKKVPVDYVTLTDEDLYRIEKAGRADVVQFDGQHHVSHYKTCKNVGMFVGQKKPRA